MSFVHLNLHSEYSLLESSIKIKSLPSLIKEGGMVACALTDYSVLYGALPFYEELVKNNIKPIIGLTIYLKLFSNQDTVHQNIENKPSTLILLAETQEGLHNLNKLSSFSFLKNKGGDLTLADEILKKYTKGLIAISGGEDTDIGRYLNKGDYQKARERVNFYLECFGRENFFLQLEKTGTFKSDILFNEILKLSKNFSLETVATHPCFYPTAEDEVAYQVLIYLKEGKKVALSTLKQIEDKAKLSSSESIDNILKSKRKTKDGAFKTAKEMELLFADQKKALDNTLKIAKRCQAKFDNTFLHLPKITIAENELEDAREELKTTVEFATLFEKNQDVVKHKDKTFSNDLYIYQKSYKGLLDKIANGIIKLATSPQIKNTLEKAKVEKNEGLMLTVSSKKVAEKTLYTKEDYLKRLAYELLVISSMGYTDYYLIVADFIAFARENNIPVGPGRGSGAGSLVAYCLGITDIDPLVYDLLFERFLNPDRVSMPDFDIDFCYERRQEVIDYVKNKYGYNKVCQVITFGTLAAKAVVRDVGRVLDLPLSLINQLAKLIPSDLGMTLNLALKENTRLVEFLEQNEDLKFLWQISSRLEGLARHSSTHAAGIVISDIDLIEVAPLSLNEGQLVVQYTKNYIEKIGLLKFDFLGLRTLSVLQETKDLIKQDYQQTVNWQDIDLEDEKVFSLISRGDTEGVFQLESKGMIHFMKRMKPSKLEEIIAGISLFRPGPMDQISKYIASMHGLQAITYDHPLLEPILKVTYGCIVYQEQVMRIVRDLAGFSLAQADIVRRAMSKKQAEELAKYEQLFLYGGSDGKGELVQGCLARGVSLEIGKKIFSEVLAFAGYAFNKPHAAGYSYLTYQTAWCKTYYPAQLLTALLNSFLGKLDSARIYLQVSKQLGLTILPLDINKSRVKFSTEKLREASVFALRFGLGAVKNVGTTALSEIVKLREETGLFKSFDDFLERTSTSSLNKKMIESLILAGAFDSFSLPRPHLLTKLKNFQEQIKQKPTNFIEGQLSLLTSDSLEIPYNVDEPDFNLYQKLSFEKEMLGFYFSDHPLNSFEKEGDVVKRSSIFREIEDNYLLYKKNLDNFSLPLEIKNIYSGKDFDTIALVTSLRVKKTLKGQEMIFLKCEDLDGELEIVVFDKLASASIKWLSEDLIIKIRGSFYYSQNKLKFLVKELSKLDKFSAFSSPEPFQEISITTKEPQQTSKLKQTEKILEVEAEQKINKELRLCIIIKPDVSKQKIKEFLNFCQQNNGPLGLSFYISSKNKWQHLSDSYNLSDDEEVLATVIEYWGVENLSIKKFNQFE